jgi:hypothetical protein
VPQTEYEAGQLGSYQTETGMVQVAGYLALGQPGRGDSPEVAPHEIYRIDLDAMGAALPYELLPVVLVESPAQAVALEPPLHAAREIDLSEGPHLSYAWQWFIFSVLTGGLYLVFVRRSERERPSLRNSVFLFLLIVCLLPWQTILAHGGGALQISNAPIGQYQVSVWNNPPTARAGQTLHVTVGIGRISTGEPVLDAAVSVTIVDESGESLTAAAATTAQSVNRLFYEADLDGVPIGTYEMQIEVTGSEGSGMLAFPLAVEPASLWPWLVGAVVAVGVTWLGLRSWRKEAKANVSVRRTAVPRPRSVD